MKRRFLIGFCIIGLLTTTYCQTEDIVIIDSMLNEEGYLCRYVYRNGDNLSEFCAFIPDSKNNIDIMIGNKLRRLNGEMLFKGEIESFLFNAYMLSLNYYILTPLEGEIIVSMWDSSKNELYEKLPKIKIPENIDYKKKNKLLFTPTWLIESRYIKDGVFLVYFGKQRVRGTVLKIKNAGKYLNVNSKWETDIRRGSFDSDLVPKYSKAKDDIYIAIEFVY